MFACINETNSYLYFIIETLFPRSSTIITLSCGGPIIDIIIRYNPVGKRKMGMIMKIVRDLTAVIIENSVFPAKPGIIITPKLKEIKNKPRNNSDNLLNISPLLLKPMCKMKNVGSITSIHPKTKRNGVSESLANIASLGLVGLYFISIIYPIFGFRLCSTLDPILYSILSTVYVYFSEYRQLREPSELQFSS